MPRILTALFAVVMSCSLHAQITIESPSVRAMPPGQPNTAAFMEMFNTSDKPVRLVKLSTNVADKAEFHSHEKDNNGVMRMRKESHVDIPANGSFVFESGGHHIMIMGLRKPLKSGEIVSLTVEDTTGTQYNFNLPVVSLVPKQGHSHHHHH